MQWRRVQGSSGESSGRFCGGHALRRVWHTEHSGKPGRAARGASGIRRAAASVANDFFASANRRRRRLLSNKVPSATSADASVENTPLAGLDAALTACKEASHDKAESQVALLVEPAADLAGPPPGAVHTPNEDAKVLVLKGGLLARHSTSAVASSSADASVETTQLARHGGALVAPPSVSASSSCCKPINEEAKEQDKPPAEPAADPAAIALAPAEDRTSIVGRCTMEAGYTSEEQAKVLVLMGGFHAIHTASDIVTDVGQDTISCRRCKLKRTGIRKNGNKFRGSPCPEESSTSNRATWITGLSKIRTREEAIKIRWRVQCLARTEHENADQSK